MAYASEMSGDASRAPWSQLRATDQKSASTVSGDGYAIARARSDRFANVVNRGAVTRQKNGAKVASVAAAAAVQSAHFP